MSAKWQPFYSDLQYVNCRYFEDDEEDSLENLEYQPAPGSPSATFEERHGDGGGGGGQHDSEDDPLDAYMAGIQVGEKNSENGEPGVGLLVE